MSRPRRRLAGWVLVVSTSTLACGGGSDRLSKSEFVTKANAVCKKAAARSDAVEAKLDERFGDDAQTPAELQAAVQEVVPIIDDTYDQLDDLKPPKDLEANFDQVVAEGRQASADLRKAAALSPEKLAAFLKGKDNPADSIDRRFGQLGLSDCKG